MSASRVRPQQLRQLVCFGLVVQRGGEVASERACGQLPERADGGRAGGVQSCGERPEGLQGCALSLVGVVQSGSGPQALQQHRGALVATAEQCDHGPRRSPEREPGGLAIELVGVARDPGVDLDDDIASARADGEDHGDLAVPEWSQVAQSPRLDRSGEAGAGVLHGAGRVFGPPSPPVGRGPQRSQVGEAHRATIRGRTVAGSGERKNTQARTRSTLVCRRRGHQ